jgi:late competence protein required for DNA uptake (superfamily II DNA/RNA helicase)
MTIIRIADFIVTGPRINLAEELIDRLHGLFTDKLGIDCKQVGPIIYVKDTIIQAFPSHTVSTMRGYTDVKVILLDEAGFFPVGQQHEVKAVTEGYRIKTNPTICIVSTPNKPGDFYESIDRDPNSIYKKIQLHYSVGSDKIYNPQQIEQEKTRSYFKREYELHYSVGVGNCS